LVLRKGRVQPPAKELQKEGPRIEEMEKKKQDRSGLRKWGRGGGVREVPGDEKGLCDMARRRLWTLDQKEKDVTQKKKCLGGAPGPRKKKRRGLLEWGEGPKAIRILPQNEIVGKGWLEDRRTLSNACNGQTGDLCQGQEKRTRRGVSTIKKQKRRRRKRSKDPSGQGGGLQTSITGPKSCQHTSPLWLGGRDSAKT